LTALLFSRSHVPVNVTSELGPGLKIRLRLGLRLEIGCGVVKLINYSLITASPVATSTAAAPPANRNPLTFSLSIQHAL